MNEYWTILLISSINSVIVLLIKAHLERVISKKERQIETLEMLVSRYEGILRGKLK